MTKKKPVEKDPWDSDESAREPWEADPWEESGTLNIVEEQHPSISVGLRALLKNFGTPKGTLSELRALFPEATIALAEGQTPASSGSGRIVMKQPGETAYRVLDPKGFELADIGDIPADIATGVASKIPALAALAGGPVSSAAVGGATSAAAEAAREGIGSLLGIRDNIDLGEIGMAGGVGATFGGLLGEGQAKGILGKIREYYPTVASRVTGIPSQTIRNLRGSIEAVEDMDAVKNPREAAAQIAEGTMNLIEGGRRETGDEIGALARQIDYNYAGQNPMADQAADQAESTFASAKDVREYLEGRWRAAKDAGVSKKERKPLKLERNAARVAEEEAKAMADAAAEEARRAQFEGPINTEQLVAGLQGEKQRLLQVGVRDANGNLAPASAAKIDEIDFVIENILGKVPARSMKAETALALKERFKDLSGYFKSQGRELMPASEQLMQSAANKGLKSIDEQMDVVSKGEMKTLRERYAKYLDAKNKAKDIYADPATAAKKLAAKVKNPAELDELTQIDSLAGTGLADQARFQDVYQYFGKPEIDFFPKAREYVAPILTAGGFAALGGDNQERQDNALLGLGVGSLLGTRSGMRRAAKMSPYADALGRYAKKTATPLFLSGWRMSRPEGEE